MGYDLMALHLRLLNIDGFVQYARNFKPKSCPDIITILTKFKEHRSKTNPFCQEELYILDLIQQQLLEYCYKHNSKLLYYINDSNNIGDEILNEFKVDWDAQKTGRFSFLDNEIQTYQTITEVYQVEEYIDNGIIKKYTDSFHPLIYSTIGRALNNGGYYYEGLAFIKKGLKYAINPTKPFWHSPYGTFGCVECLWEFVRLISPNTIKSNFEPTYKPLMELLFLYISRAIAMCEIKKMPQGGDFYRNRSYLLRNHGDVYRLIFTDCGIPFVDMDVQYISDNYLGFKIFAKHGLIGPSIDLLNDSLKMYQYGSLKWLNEDAGYLDEDPTWLQFVEIGKQRADEVAECLLNKFEKYVMVNDYLDSMADEILKTRLNMAIKYDWHSSNN